MRHQEKIERSSSLDALLGPLPSLTDGHKLCIKIQSHRLGSIKNRDMYAEDMELSGLTDPRFSEAKKWLQSELIVVESSSGKNVSGESRRDVQFEYRNRLLEYEVAG